MYKRTPLKTFIGGLVIGSLVGAFIGGIAVAMVGATAFINYEMGKDNHISIPVITKTIK